MSGGKLAIVNGQWLENEALWTLKEVLQFPVVEYRNLRTYADCDVIVKNMPFVRPGGRRGRTEFGIVGPHVRRTRLECRWQGTTGSTDEKIGDIIFRFDHGSYDEEQFVLLMVGNGFSPSTILEAKQFIKCSRSRRGFVLCSLDELREWASSQVRRNPRRRAG